MQYAEGPAGFDEKNLQDLEKRAAADGKKARDQLCETAQARTRVLFEEREETIEPFPCD